MVSSGFRIGMVCVLASGFFVWILAGLLILEKQWQARLMLAGIVIAPLFVWTFDIRVYLGLCLATLSFFMSTKAVEQEMTERLKFSPIRLLLVAKQLSVFSFSLALSLGYFVSIRTLSWDDLTPRFRLGESTLTKILQWGGRIEPNLATLGEEHKTVDDYLRALNRKASIDQTDEMTQFNQLNDQVGRLREQGINVEFSGDALASVRGAAEEATLTSGRKQIGDLVGRPVRGDEQIVAVFGEVIQNKLFAIVEGSRVREYIPNQVLPIFIAFLFFLTVWPIGLLIFPLWSLGASGIVRVFRMFRWIEIAEQPVMQERLID